MHSVGRDLDGNGQPTCTLRAHGGATAAHHHVYQLKPSEAAVAYSEGSMAGRFHRASRRKSAVMSPPTTLRRMPSRPTQLYFRWYPRGGAERACSSRADLMQSKLPGQPPPICTQPPATSNPAQGTLRGVWELAGRREPTDQAGCRRSSRSAPRQVSGRTTSRTECWRQSPPRSTLPYTATRRGRQLLETVWPGNER